MDDNEALSRKLVIQNEIISGLGILAGAALLAGALYLGWRDNEAQRSNCPQHSVLVREHGTKRLVCAEIVNDN